eukprot:4445160-Prymnesium_polylepis.2
MEALLELAHPLLRRLPLALAARRQLLPLGSRDRQLRLELAEDARQKVLVGRVLARELLAFGARNLELLLHPATHARLRRQPPAPRKTHAETIGREHA